MLSINLVLKSKVTYMYSSFNYGYYLQLLIYVYDTQSSFIPLHFAIHENGIYLLVFLEFLSRRRLCFYASFLTRNGVIKPLET